MAISAGHRLPQAMHAALGEPGLTGDLANTSLGVFTKGVENQAAFGPISHVGQSSAGFLNSWQNSRSSLGIAILAYLHIPRFVDSLISEIFINVLTKGCDYLGKIDCWGEG